MNHSQQFMDDIKLIIMELAPTLTNVITIGCAGSVPNMVTAAVLTRLLKGVRQMAVEMDDGQMDDWDKGVAQLGEIMDSMIVMQKLDQVSGPVTTSKGGDA